MKVPRRKTRATTSQSSQQSVNNKAVEMVSSSSGEEEEEEGDDNEEDEGLSQRQVSSAEMKKLAGLVCNYLLCAENKKIISKRADISKMVLKDRAKVFPVVIKKASEMLQKVYGYEVKELQKYNYVLINMLTCTSEEDDNSALSISSHNAARMGLLTTVLSAIFMCGGIMKEAQMREFLKKLNADMDSKCSHSELGNVGKLINLEFSRQKYLDISLDSSVDPPTREYRWGKRASAELSKKNILELVCKVYGNNMQPEMWTSQWQEVQNEEESRETSE